MVLNQNDNYLAVQKTPDSSTNSLSSGSFLVSVTKDTNTNLNGVDALIGAYITGNKVLGIDSVGRYIRIDQGLDTTKISPDSKLSAELTERQYMIQIDNRLGTIVDVNKPTQGSPSFIDDDQIATYYITQNVGKYVTDLKTGELAGDDMMSEQDGDFQVISGPRGTKLEFSILASDNLKASNYLFETIGQTGITAGSSTFNTINTTVKVTGVTTGYSLDIPITFTKTTS